MRKITFDTPPSKADIRAVLRRAAEIQDARPLGAMFGACGSIVRAAIALREESGPATRESCVYWNGVDRAACAAIDELFAFEAQRVAHGSFVYWGWNFALDEGGKVDDVAARNGRVMMLLFTAEAL